MLTINQINDLKNQRAKLIADMRAAVDKFENGIPTGEQKTEYNRMEKEFDKLNDQIVIADSMLQRERLIGEDEQKEEKIADQSGRSSQDYMDAFFAKVRFGAENISAEQKAIISKVQNSLTGGGSTKGAELLPTEFERKIVQKLYNFAPIRQIATVIRTANDRNIPVEGDLPTAYWANEEGAYTASDPTFGTATLGAHKLTALIKVSEELLADSAFELQNYLEGKIGLAFNGKTEDAYVNGTLSTQPYGFLKDATHGLTSSVSASFATDDVIDLFFTLKKQYRAQAAWMMDDIAMKTILKTKDSSGNYLLIPSLKAGVPDRFINRPVYNSEYMPAGNVKNNTPIAFGDFSYFWIADRIGIQMQRLNELYSGNGQVGFRAYMRTDSELLLPEAIKTLKLK